jgi:hypothetical protein
MLARTFETLRSLFGDLPEERTLEPSAEEQARIKRLPHTELFLLAALEGFGLDPATLTREQLLAEVERAARSFRACERHDPFVYRLGEQRRLPVFTNEERMHRFTARFCKESGRIYPFQHFSAPGSALTRWLVHCDAVVVDDASPDELVVAGPALEPLR